MVVLFLYRSLMRLLAPLIVDPILQNRLKKGKENPDRLNERKGFPQKERPEGTLIWMHGASVGECLSMLPLIKKILQENPDFHIMVTSGTVTSADLMAKRLPERAFHQFLPLDTPQAAKRFVTYWHPKSVLWFESDFWPNMLHAVHQANIPLILLNGRISDKSFARWQKALPFIRQITNLFTDALGQTQEDARRLQVLGIKTTTSVGNLKFAAVNPPFDAQELQKMKQAIGSRPCWCMASTHANEEEQGLEVHQQLVKKHPHLLTIIVPRHPKRAQEIIDLAHQKNLTVARRSLNQPLEANTDVYLADTIGEMGLFYQLSDIVFVGGSLIAFGGQNMLEPMRFKRLVLIGPHAFNFREIVAKAKENKAIFEVNDKQELFKQVDTLLQDTSAFKNTAQNAYQLATSEIAVLDRVYDLLHQKTYI